MITPMSRVEIIGNRRYLYPTLEELQRWGKLHIDNIPVADFVRGSLLHRVYFDDAKCKERDVREVVDKVLDEIVGQIPRETYHDLNERLKYEGKGLPEIEPGQALSFALAMQEKLQPIISRKQALTDEMSVIVEYKKVAKMFLDALSGYEIERRWEIIGLTISKEQSYIISLLKERLDEITGHNYAIFPSEPHNHRIAIVIGYEKHCAAEVEQLLFGTDIKEMPMPVKFRNRPLDVTLALIEERLLVLPFKVEEVMAELRSFFLYNGVKILLMKSDNQAHLLRFAVSSKFAQTKYTFVVRGWAPSVEAPAIKKSLVEKFQGRVVLKELPVKKSQEEDAPVILKNPKVLRPFERLISVYSLPMYGTFDPTSSVFFSFPIFFGMVLGDVGYGMLLAILAGIAFVMAKGREIIRDIAAITFYFSFTSIVFGFLYGELFGVRMGLKPLLPQLARGHGQSGVEVIVNYLILAVSFGAVHILYGISVGIFVSIKKRNITKAIEGFASILILLGIALSVCGLMQILPDIFLLTGIFLLIISVPTLIYAGGMLACLEISTLIGNVLSYCRLMALGMGSVYIIFVGDELDYLIKNVVLSKVVLVIVHMFNMMVHIAVPTIHALRLHYVEFFTKFFVHGGKPYEPLKKTETGLHG